jgi:hypothetical protein
MDIQGEWLALSQASPRLGLSVQTLRRRIKDKQIQARQVTTPFGTMWEVWIPMLDSDGEGMVNTVAQDGQSASSSSEMVEALRLISKLQEENKNLVMEFKSEIIAKAEAAAMWQARADVLQLQLSQMQQKVLMLEAPKEEPNDKNGEDNQNLPWWRAWWRGMVGV